MNNAPDASLEHAGMDFYERMLTIRRFEERCVELGARGEISGSIHLCGGQEAVPVGVRSALRDGDKVVATYRGHGWAIEWGVPLVGVLAEICQRAGGINGGRAGSPYMMAPEYGFIGENSIVGAGVPIGAGVAMAQRAAGEGSLCVVSIGDGAMNQGAVHEALNFAAVGDLPLLVVIENNAWSEMTPISATTKIPDLSERARAYGISGVSVDGNDPAAVEAAVRAAADRARAAEGPTLIEAHTVRLMAHYNRDVEHYRSDEDKRRDAERDPLPALRARLVESGVDEAELDAVEKRVEALIDDVTDEVLAMPAPDPSGARDHVLAPVPQPLRSTPLAKSQTHAMPYWQAVNEALRTELARRPEMLLYGEDIAIPGGIFGCTRKLRQEFGADRVFDTPISESAILGSAVGAALEGMRPVVEIMWADFLLVALDQLINQAANVRYVTRGTASAPLVVRTQQGMTPGSCAQHSQVLEALLAHIPGLKVGVVSCAGDAYSMLRAAIDDPDPCVLFEARSMYADRGEVVFTESPEPVGGAIERRNGSDLAIITWGTMRPIAEQAADDLEGEGIRAGVLDLRWLRPLDEERIVEMVESCGGRAIVLHEANVTGGFGAEVAARISERLLGSLQAPVARVGVPDVRIPSAPSLQGALLPDVPSVVRVARRLCGRAG